MKKRLFGRTEDGRAVEEIVLESADAAVAILSYGCVTRDWRVDGPGGSLPMVLGFHDVADYERHSRSHGAIVGRVANRIAGARFTLEIPLKRSAASRPPMEVAPAARQSRAFRILLVEDHKDTRTTMERWLRRAKHTVKSADTAAAALAAAEAESFDFVISDLGLPDQSGIELMRELRQRHGLRGIAVSAYGMEDDVARAHQIDHVRDQFFAQRHLIEDRAHRREFARPEHLLHRARRQHRFRSIDAQHALRERQLFVARGHLHFDLHHEPILLRLRKWIRPLGVRRILRREHREIRVQHMRVAIDAHHALLHRL